MKKHPWSFNLLLLIPVLLAVCVIAPRLMLAEGSMLSEEYAAFFGLDRNDPEEADRDYDEDGLSNIEENILWSDPFADDTDRDCFNDAIDTWTVSRIYLNWGDSWFTDNDHLTYVRPDWGLLSYKAGGDWHTNPPSWYVSGNASNNTGFLVVEIDRNVLPTNNVRYSLKFYDYPGSALYLDLLDTNGVAVVTNVAGNLIFGTSNEVTTVLNVPLASYEDAWALSLRRETGEIRVFESLIYVDEDGDGLDREQEAQLGTSDYNTDSDDDGLSDWDEVFIHGTDPADPDTDSDGMPDGWEVEHGLDPLMNDADSDYDGDGVSNIDEYIQGRDPRTGSTEDTENALNFAVHTMLE